MLSRLAAVLLALLAWGSALHARQKVAIIIRDGLSYPSPHLPQAPTGRVTVNSVFEVHDEKTDPQGRPWVQVSNGAQNVWLLKAVCVVRDFVELHQIESLVKLVRAQPWSDFDKQRVLRGVVDMAMTPEQVLLSWGEPLKITKSTLGPGEPSTEIEEWGYGPFSLVLRGGVVTKILSKPASP